MKHTLIILTLILLSYQAFPQNTQITSFSKSKKLLLKLYKDNPVTLYCGCSYKGKKPNLSSCGYIPKKNKKRANRIEWEHVVPAHAFGQTFSEWRKGHPKCVKKNGKKFKGRKCAEKVNKQYRRMQADMFNLYPAIGEVNGRRSLIALGQSSNVVKMFPLFMDHLGVPRNHISQLMGHEDSNMALDESSSGLAIEPLVESINNFTYGKEIDSFIKSNEA